MQLNQMGSKGYCIDESLFFFDVFYLDQVPCVVQMGHAYGGGPQPVLYNPQVPQMSSQAYYHPNGPQVGYYLQCFTSFHVK